MPALVDHDDRLLVIEMSVVNPPYVLDFGSATLDEPPDFPDEVLEAWYSEKQEQFGGSWGAALTVLAELKRAGIHLLDVHPGNIRSIPEAEQ